MEMERKKRRSSYCCFGTEDWRNNILIKFLQEAKLFFTITEINRHHEILLGKQISQVALYNLVGEVRELQTQLEEERRDREEVREVIEKLRQQISEQQKTIDHLKS